MKELSTHVHVHVIPPKFVNLPSWCYKGMCHSTGSAFGLSDCGKGYKY